MAFLKQQRMLIQFAGKSQVFIGHFFLGKLQALRGDFQEFFKKKATKRVQIELTKKKKFFFNKLVKEMCKYLIEYKGIFYPFLIQNEIIHFLIEP